MKSSPLPAKLSRLFERRSLWRTLSGSALILIGLITLLSMLNINSGGLIAPWADLLRRAFGAIGASLLCLLMIALGLPVLLNSLPRMDASRWIQLIALEVAFFAFLALIHTLSFGQDPYALVRSGAGGGAVGWVLSEAMWKALRIDASTGAPSAARLFSALIWFLIFALAAIYAARPLLRITQTQPATTPAALRRKRETPRPSTDDRPIRGAQLPLPEDETAATAPERVRAETTAKPRKTKDAVTETDAAAVAPIDVSKVKSNAKIIKQDEPAAARKYVPRPDTLPPLDLLKRAKEAKNSAADVKRQADVIEQTLIHFGLVGKVTEIRQGPTVTQFGIEPGYIEKPGLNGEKRQQKIRVGQIANLQNDFALALSAASIRIEAPIPGRSLVGIEVPNANIGTVDLRSLMESDAFRKVADKSPLAFALGKDVSGTPMCADLGRMPHLLIAGTTGSGKSVCIIAITLALVLNNRPEDLKLVMIDPKMVELSRFTGLPHIIGKPEHESERLPGVLKWVVNEMERRYKEFSKIGSRNLQEFNDSMKRRNEEPLPRIVVMIDELADMMMQAPIETEKQICRLAQMARATGIHMIVATQRPSVDVVTGLIKANFPARISFAVASGADSRVILDQTGAESLLGRGDMLFMNPETGQPQRIQGAWVSDRELEMVLKWWKTTTAEEAEARGETPPEGAAEEQEYVANQKPVGDAPWELEVAQLASERNQSSKGGSGSGGAGGMDDGGDDELVQKAMELIRTQGSVSTSLLQRKLRIGYPRAARLMEDLQEMGYVGARSQQAGKGREVNVPASANADEDDA
jgi:DNA segregation ATPase FtsK/SpoIIIE, S-DNA-T family